MAAASPIALRRGSGLSLLRRRATALAALLAATSALYALWFRDSSLVAVKTVHVEGIPRSVAGSNAIESALSDAGAEMTTLHVREGLLREAARPFPLVASVSADPSFPSTLTVRVTLRRPVALAGTDGDQVAIAGDGVVLRGFSVDGLGELPRIPLSETPKGSRLGGADLDQARLLGAAPGALLAHVEESYVDVSGVGVRLDGGVELRFGTGARAAEKWRAAAAVLSDPELGALDYVDLSAPRRPAVGGISYAPPPIAAA
jgi:cell division septal protein FtsQ